MQPRIQGKGATSRQPDARVELPVFNRLFASRLASVLIDDQGDETPEGLRDIEERPSGDR
jgi:hypothetical protein